MRAFEAVVASLGPERACVIEYEQMHGDLRGTLARLAALQHGQSVGPEANPDPDPNPHPNPNPNPNPDPNPNPNQALLGPEAEARLRRDGDAIEAALGFDAMKADAGAGHGRFLRKGVAGGWREHFSEVDEAALMAAVSERLPVEASSAAGVGSWR